MTGREPIALSRRHSLALMAGLPVLGVAGGSFAAAPSLEERLRQDLTQLVITPGPAQLELMAFSQKEEQIEADLRLYWPPGMRQRRVRVEEGDPERAYEALWDGIVTVFSGT